MRIARIETFVYRAPIDKPIIASFGAMRDRPALFVRAIDADGAEGWGEVWCNFPTVGAEHRARLIEETLAPMVLGRTWDGPRQAYRELTARTAVLAIQSGEPGPIAQAIAGIDQALWDLSARVAGEPLHRHLGGADKLRVPVYASGINPDAPERVVAAKRDEGFLAFKLKVGFGREKDLRNLAVLRDLVGDDAALMIDANQAWSTEEAEEMAGLCARFAPQWLEEPVRADVEPARWAELARRSPIPLAAGENIRGEAEFETAISDMGLRYLQPDVGKWGGFSACLGICRRALAAKLVYCPHWLGGGIGLAASLHLLAAVGGDGLLEIDSNPNPLREAILDRLGPIVDGTIALPTAPGLGVEVPMDELAQYRVSL